MKKVSPKHDMRAVCHMISSSLNYSEKPVHNEMADILLEAMVQWIEYQEDLKKEREILLKSLIHVENKNLEGLKDISKVLKQDEEELLYKLIYE